MNRTIVALYDSRSDAEAAVRDLEADGFDRSATEIVTHTSTMTTSTSTDAYTDTDLDNGTSGYGSGSRGLMSRLMGWNVPENDAHVYAEGVRRGGAMLKVRVDDDEVDRAVAVLERSNIVDLDHRAEAYRNSGWTGYDETAQPYDEQSAAEERARYSGAMMDRTSGLGSAAGAFRDVNATESTTSTSHIHSDRVDTDRVDTAHTRTEGDTGDYGTRRHVDAGREEVIPVAEERIDIGKRQVERGSVRVRSYVTETPVNEQVNLRQEHVTVERRAVDRAVDDLPEDAFREREIEVTETAEEAVVQKRAHVREEVVIRKDVEERAQNVSDTVRRTEVDVDDGRTDTARSDVDRTDVDRTIRRDDIDR